MGPVGMKMSKRKITAGLGVLMLLAALAANHYGSGTIHALGYGLGIAGVLLLCHVVFTPWPYTYHAHLEE